MGVVGDASPEHELGRRSVDSRDEVSVGEAVDGDALSDWGETATDWECMNAAMKVRY